MVGSAPPETTIRSPWPTSRRETQRLRPRIGALDAVPARAGYRRRSARDTGRYPERPQTPPLAWVWGPKRKRRRDLSAASFLNRGAGFVCNRPSNSGGATLFGKVIRGQNGETSWGGFPASSEAAGYVCVVMGCRLHAPGLIDVGLPRASGTIRRILRFRLDWFNGCRPHGQRLPWNKLHLPIVRRIRARQTTHRLSTRIEVLDRPGAMIDV
jgi:hypothetical protein